MRSLFESNQPLGDGPVQERQQGLDFLGRIHDLDDDRQVGREFEELRRVDAAVGPEAHRPRSTVAPASPSSRAFITIARYSGLPSHRSDSPMNTRSNWPLSLRCMTGNSSGDGSVESSAIGPGTSRRIRRPLGGGPAVPVDEDVHRSSVANPSATTSSTTDKNRPIGRDPSTISTTTGT